MQRKWALAPDDRFGLFRWHKLVPFTCGPATIAASLGSCISCDTLISPSALGAGRVNIASLRRTQPAVALSEHRSCCCRRAMHQQSQDRDKASSITMVHKAAAGAAEPLLLCPSAPHQEGCGVTGVTQQEIGTLLLASKTDGGRSKETHSRPLTGHSWISASNCAPAATSI